MSNSNIINDKIVRVSDILEQIDELNKMIKVHQENSENSMLKQYECMKKEFLDELNKILIDFQISVKAA